MSFHAVLNKRTFVRVWPTFSTILVNDNAESQIYAIYKIACITNKQLLVLFETLCGQFKHLNLLFYISYYLN